MRATHRMTKGIARLVMAAALLAGCGDDDHNRSTPTPVATSTATAATSTATAATPTATAATPTATAVATPTATAATPTATASPGCTPVESSTATSTPTPCLADCTPTPVKPTFDWGYPQYSEYVDGHHVGTTLYQQDPICRERLTFYTCEFVNGNTPDDPENNPTGASVAMFEGDRCTDAIDLSEPSYCMPADLCNPKIQRPAWAPGQASADNLAWQLFVALNWPANAAEPGYPDPAQELGAANPSGVGHAASVWQDYPTPGDLFGVPSSCEGPTLTMSSKVSADFLSKPHPPGATGGLGDTVEAGGGTLVDQNGKVVYFEIRVNRTEWEFIVNQNDYWMSGASLAPLAKNVTRDYCDKPGQTRGAFPSALVGDHTVPGDVGAIEIKAAWKQLTEAEIAGGTYYTRVYNLYDATKPPAERCTQHTMGLVGMHIVYMPALFGNPEWVWATFEHRLNVPSAGVNDGATAFSFYDPDCTPVKTPAECAAYNPKEPKKDSPAEFHCCPNLDLYPGDTSPSATDLAPNQVTRPTNPTVSTILPTDCTSHYLKAIAHFFGDDNVFTNYFLVATQWPLRGASTNAPAYKPTFEAHFPCTLRDSTLESFAVGSQVPALNGCTNENNDTVPFCRSCNGDCVRTSDEASVPCPGGMDSPDQFTTADCIGCHGMYAPQNSSFIFSHRPCCVRRDGGQPNTCGSILKQEACSADTTCVWVSGDSTCPSM